MATQMHGPESAESPHYDPFEFHDDPYPAYARLRAEMPLYHNKERDLWVVTRFDDIQDISRNWKTFSSGQGVVLDDESEFYAPGGFVDQDPPSHDRLRAVMAPYFAPKTIKQLEVEVRAKTRELLAPFAEQGQIDLGRDISRPLPAAVVCMLFGFPAADHELLSTWFAQMLERIPGQIDAPASAWEANAAMREYFAEAAHTREQEPNDDLLTVLSSAHRDGTISQDEVVGLGIFMFYSGIITTAGLISNSLLNLLDYPDQRTAMASDPAVMQEAIEELLRYDAPIQSLSRVTLEDATLHGTVVPEGSRVLLVWGSANRDDSRWPDAGRLDIFRDRKRHLAFGEGIHYCIGAPLARLEAAVVFEEVLALMPDYELCGPTKRIYTPHERGVESLPVAFESPSRRS
jgi:cytochrome P450